MRNPRSQSAWWPVPAALHAATLCVVVLAVAACGSSSSTTSRDPHRPPPATGLPPSTLLGTYTTTIRRSDLPPNPSAELTDGSRTWKLTITNSGGANGRRTFTLANAKLGELESSPLVVHGDKILLHGEECDAGGTQNLYDNEYGYTLVGRTLRFTTVTNRCGDQVARTILTSEPWKKTGRRGA